MLLLITLTVKTNSPRIYYRENVLCLWLLHCEDQLALKRYNQDFIVVFIKTDIGRNVYLRKTFFLGLFKQVTIKKHHK